MAKRKGKPKTRSHAPEGWGDDVERPGGSNEIEIEFEPTADTRLHVPFDSLALFALQQSGLSSDAANVEKFAKRTQQHFELLKLRLDAWTADIAIVAAIAQTIDDVRRGDIDDSKGCSGCHRTLQAHEKDLRSIAAKLGKKLPIPKPARDYILERLKHLPAAALPWQTKGKPRGSHDGQRATRRRKREEKEQQLDTLKEIITEETIERQRSRGVTTENVSATARASFDKAKGNKKEKGELYSAASDINNEKRGTVRVRHSRMTARVKKNAP